MLQVLISRTGPPAEVAEIAEIPTPVPEPGPGEVSIRMVAAPVNPADLNFLEGTYGKKAVLPCVPGMEGAGVVEAVGHDVTDLKPGMPVMPVGVVGNWTARRVLSGSAVLPLPAGIDMRQAAMLAVNPATAWGLLHAAGAPAPGAWVAQNAASSAAGHCVIQIAKVLGLRTVNFVRRPESAAACRQLGADMVFPDDTDGLAAAKAALAEQQVQVPLLALNAVGGDSALRLLDLLGMGGTHVTYGAMGRQALKVPNGMLIFKTLTLRGFWLSQWQASLPRKEASELYAKLADWVLSGHLRQEIAAVYPLTEIKAALAHAGQSARGGKVLLDIS
ncbi:MAG: Alcohol dehydrogenase zinc-binding domain protein [Verrucomicrobiales bacterium]|nr:Alcohol dehydrogenase zinc-binding domain protein [Verrucomicrobiales bacterium]